VITGYKIYRSTASGAEQLIAEVGAVTSYTEANLAQRDHLLLQGVRAEPIQGVYGERRPLRDAGRAVTVPGPPVVSNRAALFTGRRSVGGVTPAGAFFPVRGDAGSPPWARGEKKRRLRSRELLQGGSNSRPPRLRQRRGRRGRLTGPLRPRLTGWSYLALGLSIKRRTSCGLHIGCRACCRPCWEPPALTGFLSRRWRRSMRMYPPPCG
jgi:hypothetical protein